MGNFQDSLLFTEVYGYKSDATTQEAQESREEQWWEVSTGERWAAECPSKAVHATSPPPLTTNM